MTLQGNTILAGDSITVGLSPFVGVSGQKKTIAEGGRPVSWLLQTMRTAAAIGGLDGFQNLLVLIGTNDIGGGRTPEAIVADTLAIWALAKGRGLRVFAMTIPPVKGYDGFAKNFPAVNARRKAINAGLGQAFVQGASTGLIDLSALLADSNDPEKLAAPFDSGDHLHPRKDAMGALLTRALSGLPLPNSSPSPNPGGPLATGPSSSPLGAVAGIGWGEVLLVGALGIGTYMLTRKHYRLGFR